MSTEVIKILDALAQRLGVAVDWTADNVAPYLQQLCSKYVTYEMATSVAWIVIGLIVCLIGAILLRSASKTDWFFDSDLCVILQVATVICGILSIISILAIAFQVFDIITCTTFPEKIILDELRLLMQ